jgi:hypothetical protein
VRYNYSARGTDGFEAAKQPSVGNFSHDYIHLTDSGRYGVSRVYDQQCHYVLLDAQAAHNGIRTMLMSAKNNDLEPGAGKTR